jgi:hypothetical protein
MPGYNCPSCKTECYRDTIGPHIIKQHPEFVKTVFKGYASITQPVAPYKTAGGFYLCLICKQYHTSTVSAKKHLETCTAEQQIEAIYTLIGARPDKTRVQVAAEVARSDKGLLKMIHDRDAEISRLKGQLTRANGSKDAYKMWAEKDRYMAVSLWKEKYETLVSRLEQDNGDGWQEAIDHCNTIQYDEADENRLSALADEVDYWKGRVTSRSAVISSTQSPHPLESVEPKVPTLRVLEITAGLEVMPPPPAPILKITPQPSHCQGCRHEATVDQLTSCNDCKHIFHVNDELWGCYMYDCEKCNKRICYNCMKANGSSKLHPCCKSCKPVAPPPRPAGPMPVPGSYTRY